MRRCLSGLLIGTLLPLAALAGGGPQNVLVVVNDNSIESQEIGQYYAAQRGIPQRNVCHISMSPTVYRVEPGLFQTQVVDRITQHIAAQGLSNQIDYVVLCKDIPYAIRWYGDNNIQNGAAAAVFYGLKVYSTPYGQIHSGTTNGYYMTERCFRHTDSYQGTNYYATMLLTAYDLVQAKALVDRSVEADGSFPTGTYYLCKTSDAYRNIRYKSFDEMDFDARFFPDFPLYEFFQNQWNGVSRREMAGYLQALAVPNTNWIFSNTYFPGAMADHLTSAGGFLFDAALAYQMSILEWIKAGVSASYGTVVEPYTFLEKFPHPLNYLWQARGFNNAESYWMSVRNPYQGLFVGDPLAAPFARPPSVAITNLLSNQVVCGVVTVEVAATTNAAGTFSQAVDLYVDDLFEATLTNAPPAPGNVLRISVNSVTCSYTVAAGDTLLSAVSNLAGRVNASNLIVRAQFLGDRLQLVYTNYGYSGTSVTYGVETAQGTASVLRVWGTALSTNLLECEYVAREFLLLRGTSSPSDWVRAIITLTNGVAITNQVNPDPGESAQSVMSKLRDMINSNATLQAPDGVKATNFVPYSTAAEFSLDARTPGPQGYGLRVAYTVKGPGFYASDSFTNHFDDNADVLTARGNILFRCGQDPLEASYTWDTTALPNGPHKLRAVAREGTAVEAQGHCLLPVIVSNSAFTCTIVAPTNLQDVALGDSVTVTAVAENASGSVTQYVIYVEGKPAAVTTNGVFEWNTRTSGVGRIGLSAVAWDSGGGGQQARAEEVMVDVRMSPTIDSDGDGVADEWEQKHFGGLYVYGATNDPDGDTAGNLEEYYADTIPTNAASYFTIGIRRETNQNVSVALLSSTGRTYRPYYNDGFATNDYYTWTAASTSFWGIGATQTWTDDGSATSPDPTLVTQRLYRLRVWPP